MTPEFRSRLLGEVSIAPVRYFSEHALDEGLGASNEISLKDFPSVIYCLNLQRDDRSNCVWICWASRDAFVRDGERIGVILGGRLIHAHGYLGKTLIPREPWWKKAKWYTIALSIAAFLGAMQAMGTYFDWLFAQPNLDLVSDSPDVSLIEGQSFELKWHLSNRLPTAHRNIAVTATLQPEAGSPATELNATPKKVPHVAKTSAEELVLSGTAPAAGKYNVTVRVASSAGLLRSHREQDFLFPARVWPKSPLATIKGSGQGVTGLLSGSIAVGRAAPDGLDCELVIQGTPALSFEDAFDIPGLGSRRWQTNEAAGHEVALLLWSLGPTAGKKEISFQIGLSQLPSADWAHIAKQASIQCDYRTGEAS